MLELPEVVTLARQADQTLKGKRIAHVFNATKPHRFTFYNGDPLEYGWVLVGETVETARACGMFLDLPLTGGRVISVGDGVNVRYAEAGEKIPENYQLLIAFDDDSFLVFTVSMYGFINVFSDGVADNKYHEISRNSISPLSDEYTAEVFGKLFESRKNLSAKALLATEQRIPGVGNGVLQDILFNARIMPKRKVSDFTEREKAELFRSLKVTLREMTRQGGRDTQKDLYGKPGGYPTILSAATWKRPCPVCGGPIVKEAYMGGTIYYCPCCQK